jgi:hypothetical protein
MGSGLMIRKRPLEIIARTMASVLSRPLTIKMRTGVFKDKNIAHTIFPQLEEVGVRKGNASDFISLNFLSTARSRKRLVPVLFYQKNYSVLLVKT